MAVPSTAVDTTRAPVVEDTKDAQVETASSETTIEAPAEEPDSSRVETESEQVTFVCKECCQTFQYGKEEGKGKPCECGKGLLVEFPEQAEPTKEEKIASLFMEVNGIYEAKEGKDFIEFAAYVLCLDDSEIVPSKLTEEQYKQIKAYIETNGVAIN